MPISPNLCKELEISKSNWQEMQDPKKPLSEAITKPKLHKKKTSSQQASTHQFNNLSEVQQLHGSMPLGGVHKASNSKKNFKDEVPILFHQNPDLLNEYRALRREYLLLEEANTSLERELRDFEDGVKTLEDEKHELLDQLVVLEGLVDPSEMQSPVLSCFK